jgi:hypothetical protein
MPLPKGMAAPAIEGEALWFSTDTPNPDVFDKLPTWVQDKIAARIIDKPKVAAPAPAAPAAFVDDEVAF